MLLESNDTEADLLHLVPGTRYSIAVLARNAHGEGRRSEELIVFTVRPEGKCCTISSLIPRLLSLSGDETAA